ncbi:uncharacterized protein LOC127139104 isoform X3 [Lates calcarifer]|uniref:Uncharacterized protein LOC127139104 isoform X3 n=1 Tax=Lates calcarifer TaxID=8187 RepID=A0AAJ8AWV1_LATCA|nr:uncharacterized protein LOC127139104 isoform X3 [Lates calcarifer]
MIWQMEIHSQLRGCILRTFSPSDSDPQYCSPSFKTKFSVQRNSLVIKNIIAGDCRRYFCAKKKNDSIVYVDTFRLVSDVSTTQSPQSPQSTTSCETTHQQERHKWTVWQDSRVVYTSFTLNAFLFLLVLGLISVLCLMKNGDPSPFTCENQETLVTVQYEMVPPGECGQKFQVQNNVEPKVVRRRFKVV